MLKKKTKKKKEKEVQEDVIVKIENIGEVLPEIADENNPIGDGLEFKKEEE